ncbi:E3 SUMO-protein ligase ZBED1-like [Hydra vulgaris]|uniref:E3 SUMO-protein ligase ZBED1-like n=1 Tax=Hydra vulgaris TaxID=6087 RepID=A0ABM4B9X8_HYDVU
MKLAVKLSKRLDQYLCNNHILQCAVRDSFGMTAGMDDALQTCKDLASLTHQSTVAAECLNQNQTLKESILDSYANLLTQDGMTISASQWKSIEGAVEILEPLKEATETWSAESIPIINTVANSLYLIHDKIDHFIETDGRMATGLHLKLFKKFQTTKEWLASQVKDNVECQPVARVLSADLSPNSKLKRKLNVRLETQEPTSELNPILSEMCQYEYLPDAKKDFPILDWWKLHSNALPELSSLARQILAIPASSTNTERVFSSGGNVVHPDTTYT